MLTPRIAPETPIIKFPSAPNEEKIFMASEECKFLAMQADSAAALRRQTASCNGQNGSGLGPRPLDAALSMEWNLLYSKFENEETMTLSKTIFVTLSLLAGSLGFTDDGMKSGHAPMQSPLPSLEQRKAMADAHDKMATCLRSDQMVDDCKNQMMKTCQDTLGKKGCLMGSHKMHGKKKPRKEN